MQRCVLLTLGSLTLILPYSTNPYHSAVQIKKEQEAKAIADKEASELKAKAEQTAKEQAVRDAAIAGAKAKAELEEKARQIKEQEAIDEKAHKIKEQEAIDALARSIAEDVKSEKYFYLFQEIVAAREWRKKVIIIIIPYQSLSQPLFINYTNTQSHPLNITHTVNTFPTG